MAVQARTPRSLALTEASYAVQLVACLPIVRRPGQKALAERASRQQLRWTAAFSGIGDCVGAGGDGGACEALLRATRGQYLCIEPGPHIQHICSRTLSSVPVSLSLPHSLCVSLRPSDPESVETSQEPTREHRRVPYLQVGDSPVEVTSARLVGAACVRGALVAEPLGAGRAPAAHAEVAQAPLRPVVQTDLLVPGGSNAGALWQKALRLARLQPEEEVRRGSLVDAAVAAAGAAAVVRALRTAGIIAPRCGRLCATKCTFPFRYHVKPLFKRDDSKTDLARTDLLSLGTKMQGGKSEDKQTHVATESVAHRVAREHHSCVVLVAQLEERGRAPECAVVVREGRVAGHPDLRRWFPSPRIDRL